MADVTDTPRRNPVAKGVSVFAGAILGVAGVAQALAGIAAIADDTYLVKVDGYLYAFDATAWGVIHLLFGLALAIVGFAIITAKSWALVIGMVLALGFLLLLVALQAPLAALIGTVTNLLATGAAFGVAKLLFQDGIGAGLLGFESQGFLDAWGPVFFFAMIFAISMDYTVFLLSSAREHWERGEGPRAAMVGGLAHSGRVILAAAAVMVAVFLTFALSGPLPPKEMGIILGIAVLLDALLVRLLLVPVLLRLAGSAAWWLPRPLARVLPAVRFGH